MKTEDLNNSKFKYISLSFLFALSISFIGITLEDLKHNIPLNEVIGEMHHYVTPVFLALLGGIAGYFFWKNKYAIHLQLLETESTFKTYVNQSSDAYFMHDMEGRIFDSNKRASEILGFLKDEFAGVNYYGIDKTENNNVDYADILKSLQKDESIICERLYQGKDGSLLPVEVKVCKVFSEGRALFLSAARDISERKRNQQRLMENEEKFQKAFMMSSLAIAIASYDELKLLDINKGFENTFGYARHQALSKTAGALLKWEKDEFNLHDLKKELDKDGCIRNKELIFYHKNGSPIYTIFNVEVIHINMIPHVLITAQDITNRTLIDQKIKSKNEEYKTLNIKFQVKNINLKAALKAITKSEEQFKNLFNLTFEGIVIHEKGIAKNINQSFAKIFGYMPEELVGKNIMELFADENSVELIQKNAQKKHALPYEVMGVKKDGTHIPLEIESKFIADSHNNKILRLAAVRDLSFRKEAEKEIHKLSTAVEQSANSIVITDISGKVEYANQKFYNTTGYSMQELVGKSTKLLKSGNHPDHFYKELWETIKAGKVWTGEINNRKKNGDLFWESSIITPVFNARQEITNFIAIKEDITEKKSAQKKLLHAIIETEEKERKKFAEDLHDELGPHMSGIRLYASTLKKNSNNPAYIMEIAELVDEMVKEAIEKTRSISNMLMPNILMDFGVEMAIKSFCKRITDTNEIQFELHLNELNRPLHQAIEIALYRITIELITNTLKYADASKISIDLMQHKDSIELTYQDNGMGFCLTEVVEQKKGLGLNNILNRIKTMDGSYAFQSEPEKGIQIKITIFPSKIFGDAT